MNVDFQFIFNRDQQASKLIVCINISNRDASIIVQPEDAINSIKYLGVLHTGHRSSGAVVEGLGDAGQVRNIIDEHNVHG